MRLAGQRGALRRRHRLQERGRRRSAFGALPQRDRRVLRPCRRRGPRRGPSSNQPQRAHRAQGGRRLRLGERAESAAPPVYRRELRKAAGKSYRRCGLSPRRIPTSQPDLTEAPLSRTIKFAQAGAPEVLEFIETQVPAPGPREVRIKVKAIGINRAESMWRNDKYIEPVKFPAGLGYEAAGVVDAVGKDVTDVAVGDAVSTVPAFSLNQYFTYGEVIVAPVHAV